MYNGSQHLIHNDVIYHIRATERTKYATISHCRAKAKKHGLKAEQHKGHTEIIENGMIVQV